MDEQIDGETNREQIDGGNGGDRGDGGQIDRDPIELTGHSAPTAQSSRPGPEGRNPGSAPAVSSSGAQGELIEPGFAGRVGEDGPVDLPVLTWAESYRRGITVLCVNGPIAGQIWVINRPTFRIYERTRLTEPTTRADGTPLRVEQEPLDVRTIRYETSWYSFLDDYGWPIATTGEVTSEEIRYWIVKTSFPIQRIART